MKPKSRFLVQHSPVCLALAITMAMSHLPQAYAADGTWTSDGTGDINWSNTANWSGGVVANGAGSTATFSSVNGYYSSFGIVLNSSRTIGNLTFGPSNPDTYSSTSWDLYDREFYEGAPANILTLAVSAGAPTMTVNHGDHAFIYASIHGTAGLTKAGTGSLYLCGNNTYTGTTTINGGTLSVVEAGTLGVDAALTLNGGQLELNGTTQTVGAVVLNDGGIGGGSWYGGGTGNLIATSYNMNNGSVSAGLGGTGANFLKVSEGTVSLSGANTYTGTTTVSAGTLQFVKSSSLYNGEQSSWTAANISVAGGATLAVGIGGEGTFSAAEAGTLLGNLTTSIDNNGMKAGSTFAISTSYHESATFDSVIADSTGTGGGVLGFTKLGSGTLTLSQANTYTGPTTITAGTLAISGAGTLGNSSALIVNGNDGSLDLGGTTQSAGVVTMNGRNVTNGNVIATSYTLNNGTISAGLGGAGANLTVNGFVGLAGNNTYTGETTINGTGIGSTRWDSRPGLTLSGSGTLGNQAALTLNDGQLFLGGTTQTVGAVTINGESLIENGNLIGTSYTANKTDTETAAKLSAGLGGAGANFVKTGTGRVELSGANTYTGTTAVQAGTLVFGKAASLYNGNASDWTKTNISVAAGGTLAVNVGGTGGFTMDQAKTLLTNLSTNINNNGLQAGSAFAISGSGTFDQVIADSTGTGGGALGLTRLGIGTLSLSRANTYTGPTTISGGWLEISGDGTLGNHSALSLNSWGLLDLGGTTQTVGAVNISSGFIQNGNLIASSYTVEQGGDAFWSTPAGLGGTGANLNKVGEGTFYLQGSNTYTGTTTISAGVLQFDKTASLYNSDTAKWTKTNISVAAGATLGIRVGGTGEFSVGQAKTLLSNLTTNINNNGLLAGSIFAIDTSSAEGDTTFNQVIANSTGTGGGAVGLTKDGYGTLILNQHNTYTGPTTINRGSIAISGAGTLGQNSALTINDASLDLGGTTQSVGAVNIKGYYDLTSGSVSNGNLIGTSYTIESQYSGEAISAGLGGTGANFSKTGSGDLTLSGRNTYTGMTSINDGTLQFAKAASLYDGNTAKWTSTNISVTPGFGYAALAVNVGGTGEFTVAQVKTLLSNLTTNINNNGLQADSIFAIDTSNAPGETTFNQVIADSTGTGAGALNFTKLGGNTLILDKVNTYSGMTVVSAGTLVINGSVSTGNAYVASGATLVVNGIMGGYTEIIDGATLSGSGTLNSVTVAVGGIIAPGNSPGVIHTGDISIYGTLAAEINGTSVGTDYDQVDVIGAVDLGGMLTLTMSGFTPSIGNLFFLINNDEYDGVYGTFAGLDQGTQFEMAGQLWSISYDADSSSNSFSGGNDVALMAIPESSAALLGGLGMLILLRRRRA